MFLKVAEVDKKLKNTPYPVVIRGNIRTLRRMALHKNRKGVFSFERFFEIQKLNKFYGRKQALSDVNLLSETAGERIVILSTHIVGEIEAPARISPYWTAVSA